MKSRLDEIIGRAIHPLAVGYQGITWYGVIGWIDYSCPSGPGQLKAKGIGRHVSGRVVVGQINADAEWRHLPRSWEDGGADAIVAAMTGPAEAAV